MYSIQIFVVEKLILSLLNQNKEVQTNQLLKYLVECNMVCKKVVEEVIKVEVTNMQHFHNMVIVEATEKEGIMMIIKTMITIQTTQEMAEIAEKMILIGGTEET